MAPETPLSLLERQVAIPSRRHLWIFLFCCATASMMGAAVVVTQSLRSVHVHVHQAEQRAIAARAMGGDSDSECPTTSINAALTRSEYQAIIGRGSLELAPPRIVPTFAHGAPVGFKIYAIRPDSIWARIGLLNGDTIRKVQGIALTSPDQALSLYSRLQLHEPAELHVDLTREGCPATLDVTILAEVGVTF